MGANANVNIIIEAIDKTQSAFTSVTGGLQSIGAVATTALVGAGALVVATGAKLLDLGSDASEMQSKFNVVFSEVGGVVTDALYSFADAAGRSKYELMGYAATLGDTLKPMGFSEAAAGDLSVQLVELATDLGSFNNMPMDEALQRLQGTLIGSHENALAFGVVINENTLKAELAANGWDKLTGSALEQAKVQARINLLMAGTTDAQGDAIRTADGWANATRGLVAKFKDFSTELGMKLLPVMTPLLSRISTLAEHLMPKVSAAFEKVIPVLTTIATAIGNFIASLDNGMSPLDAFTNFLVMMASLLNLNEDEYDNVSEKIAGFRDRIEEAVQKVTAFLEPVISLIANNVQLSDVLTAVGIAIASFVIPAIVSLMLSIAPLIAIFAGLVALVALVRNAWVNNWGDIQGKTQEAWQVIQEAFKALVGWINDVIIPKAKELYERWTIEWWPKISAALRDAWNNVILPALTSLKDFIINTVIPTVLDLYEKWVTEWWPAISEALRYAWEEIISPALTALKNFVMDTLLPTIKDLWDKWVNVWWPAISKQLEVAWSKIEPVFNDINDFIKDDLKPTVEALHTIWTIVVWPAIQKAVETVWDILKPIFDKLHEWFDVLMPVAVEAAKVVWEGVWSAIGAAVQGAWNIISGIFQAIRDFADWLKGASFHINITSSGGAPATPAGAGKSSYSTFDPRGVGVTSTIGNGRVGANPVQQSVTNYNINATYKYQDEMTLSQDIRRLDLLRAV